MGAAIQADEAQTKLKQMSATCETNESLAKQKVETEQEHFTAEFRTEEAGLEKKRQKVAEWERLLDVERAINKELNETL